MRNLFDQYDNPENRLTHALVSCLSEEPALLRGFTQWVTGERPPASRKLEIIEQQLPGEDEISEEESDKRGLPDAWIHDGGAWSLIVESKVASSVSVDQLRRHRITAERRGFDKISQLVITIDESKPRNNKGVRFLTWTKLYRWMCSQSKISPWARRMASYMEVAEAKMASTGYLREGTLTEFSGIPFDEKNAYNYREAKRVLKLAIQRLQANKQLQKRLGMDPKGQGRPAITGQDGSTVWDFLPLKVMRGNSQFTKFPHLTLSIHRDKVLAMVTIPNGLKASFRRNLVDLGKDGFFDLIIGLSKSLSKALRNAKGAVPQMYVVQRHFPTQRSRPIEDARLEFDLRTVSDYKRGRNKVLVKTQPQWLTAAYQTLAHKRSNLQFGIGAVFPYRTCPELHTPRAIDLFATTWLSCKPLLDATLGES